MSSVTRLDSLSFERPLTVAAALALREKAPADTAFYSGGSDLLPTLKHKGSTFSRLISLSGIAELKQIVTAPSRVSIGSQVTLDELIRHTALESLLPVVSATARLIASPQIRNRATVGGNLLVNNRCTFFNQSEINRESHGLCYKANGNVCHLVPNSKPGDLPLCRARFVSDLAPVFLLLNAFVILRSPEGQRELSLSDFYLGDGIKRNLLQDSEVLTTIHFDVNPSQKIVYEKLRIRQALDFPSVGVALSWQASTQKLGVAVSGVNPKPILHWQQQGPGGASEMLEGVIAEVTKAAQPLKQDFFTPGYRKKMIGVFIRRNFEKVLSNGC